MRVAVVRRSPWPPSVCQASLTEESSGAHQDLTNDVLDLAVAAARVWDGCSVWHNGVECCLDELWSVVAGEAGHLLPPAAVLQALGTAFKGLALHGIER
eukprot:15093857-Heterocapsa_arctica.AAC.1